MATRKRQPARPKGAKPNKSGKSAKPVKADRSKFNPSAVERGVRLILDGIGENASREGLVETPRRVREFYEEILSGMWEDPARHLENIEKRVLPSMSPLPYDGPRLWRSPGSLGGNG